MLRREYKIKTLDTEEVAWLLGTDNKTIGQLVNMGILKPCGTTDHGDRLFLRSDIARLLEKLGA